MTVGRTDSRVRGGLLTIGECMASVCSSTPGPLAHAEQLRLGSGGAESNVAIGVRRLGGAAAWVGRVGADPLGTRVLRDVRGEDVVVHAVTDPEARTGLMVRERRTAERGRVDYYRQGSAGSRLTPEDVPPGWVESAAVVHLTGITPGLSASAAATVHSVLGRARRAGTTVSFDVNHRSGVWRDRDARAAYGEIAAQAAVVFAGPDEARLLCGSAADEPADLLADLAAVCGGDAVLKLGADGCIARVDDLDLLVPAIPVDVVDPVGAGDAFVAGYLTELMAAAAPAVRLRTAVRCGSLVCTTVGDWEGLPNRGDLLLPGADDAVRR